MKSLAVLLLAGTVALSAHAEDSVKYDCVAPVVPQAHASDTVLKYFYKHMDEYKKCTDKFVEERRAYSREVKDPVKSKAAFDAAEDAQKAFNAKVDELNKMKTDAGMADEEK